MATTNDLRTRIAERISGINLNEIDTTLKSLREEAQSHAFNEEILTERMAELELALEDANWMRLMLTGQMEFSRAGLKKITELARLMYIKNPLINRAVSVKASYIFGQGVNIRAKDSRINAVLQSFWDDEKNRAELTGHQSMLQKEVDFEVEGNLFFVFFVRPTDGRVRVRTIPTDEIQDVISNPEDKKEPWFYERMWQENKFDPNSGTVVTTQRKTYYPDWKYNPKVRIASIGNYSVEWESPIYHVKTGGLGDWKFGVSEMYAAIDWARAYKEFLEDVASLMRAYSRFAWKATTKGGSKSVAALKAKLATTVGNDNGVSIETNPPPVSASMAVMGEGVDLQPIQLRGASINPDDGRRILLMVASATGFPETYFGDVSAGTLATAKSMDRPTELMMRERQVLWTDMLKDIFGFVLLQSAKAMSSPLYGVAEVVQLDDDDEYEYRLKWNEDVKAHLDVDFPPILEKDIQTSVQSVVTALTLNGQQFAGLVDEPTATRMILNALGQDDVDEIMAEIYPDQTKSVTNTPPAATESAIVEAAKKVIAALDARKAATNWISRKF